MFLLCLLTPTLLSPHLCPESLAGVDTSTVLFSLDSSKYLANEEAQQEVRRRNRMIYWVNFSPDSLPTIPCRQTSFFSWRSRRLLRNSSPHDILFSGFRNHFFLPLLQTERMQPHQGNALHGLIACLGSYQIKSDREKHCILMHTCGILKNGYFICKTEIEIQTQWTNIWMPRGKEEVGGNGIDTYNTIDTMYKLDN